MKYFLFTLLAFMTLQVFSQTVNLRYCPNSFSRNNGNGQEVKVFAANILPGSQYATMALKSGNQGNFFFNWDNTVIYPPVIQRTWITTSDGTTIQNWQFGQTSTGTPFNPPSVPSGNQVTYTYYRENLPPAQYVTFEFTDPINGQSTGICTYDFSNGTSGGLVNSSVTSGSDGGLESKSIGTALAERVFNRAINSLPTQVEYNDKTDFSQARVAANTLYEFFPDKSILGVGYQSFETSPKDIVTFTNALEVVAVDYLFAGLNKAVVFCTRTEGGAYTHTKQVCDRLKGAELLSIDTTTVKNLKVLRHLYKKKNKFNEYAITFTIGKNNNSSNYAFQSEWLINNVASQNTIYNFQIWSSEVGILNKLFESVISKFESKGKVIQTQIPKKPIVYVTRASRDLSNPLLLNLLIRNESSLTDLRVKADSKANEQSSNRDIKEQIFKIPTFKESVVQINLMDMAESEISLLNAAANQQGNIDFIYSNDGVWNYYMPNNEKPTQFTISNDQIRPASGEYRLFRNISIKAKIKDYLTVYRVINGGAEAADLSAYKGIQFTSSGQNKIRIRLIKKSVQKYEEQYQFAFETGQITKTYIIPFEKFTSSKNTKTIDASDLENVSFTFENDGGTKDLVASINEVKFITNTSKYADTQFILANEPTAEQFDVYPNPVINTLNIKSASQTAEQVTISISNVIGRTLYSENIQVSPSNWDWQYQFNNQFLPGTYFITITNTKGRKTKVITFQ